MMTMRADVQNLTGYSVQDRLDGLAFRKQPSAKTLENRLGLCNRMAQPPIPAIGNGKRLPPLAGWLACYQVGGWQDHDFRLFNQVGFLVVEKLKREAVKRTIRHDDEAFAAT